MTRYYLNVAFTPLVTQHQATHGSAGARLAASDSRTQQHRAGWGRRHRIPGQLVLASVGETGWPYMQRRGGPPSFLKVIDETTLGFADFRGTASTSPGRDVDHDSRVSLFLIDFQPQAGMKIFGRAGFVEPEAIPG